MILSLKTDMSSVVILYMILIEGVFGTYFPPVNNPPPVPGPSVRALENPRQGFYVQENLQQDFSPRIVKEGLYPSEEKIENQRWYFEDNQSGEPRQDQGSTETFDRFYQSGEPAIGPVATPIPDDTYLSQPPSIPKLIPNEPVNSDVWILTRRPYKQFIPDRWIRIQKVPGERIVQVINPDPVPPPPTDTVKSVVAPVSSDVPVKSQFTANTLPNIIQQVWVRSPKALSSQILENPPEIIEVPSVKQVVDIPTGNVEQVVQQQRVEGGSIPIPNPPPSALITKKTFSVPPPLPPPLKGFDPTFKATPVIPVNTISDSNLLAGDNGMLQPIRHIWVPTSPRTGKFISFPVPTSLNTIRPIPSPDLPLDATPVAVSDTWVLKPGPIPSFEQRKSILPPPEIQSGKVIFQAPPIIKIDAPPEPPIIAHIDPSKIPITGKSIDFERSIDIWPSRNDIQSPAEIPYSPPASPKSDDVGVTKPLVPTTALSNPKPPIPVYSAKTKNGKPCPIPLPPPLPHKYFLSPGSPNVIPVPRLLATQRRPLPRIVRVNRFPSGSYYLLNNGIRPSFFTYPNVPPFQTKFVRLVQPNTIPLPFPNRQAPIPLPPKQIKIPQIKQYPVPVPAKQVLSPFQAKQIAAPISPPKSPGFNYPAMYTKYLYPWNSKNIPVPAKGVFSPKSTLPISISGSESETSSESSSASEEPGMQEKSTSDEREKESDSEVTENNEKLASLKAPDESIEAAESQTHSEAHAGESATPPSHKNVSAEPSAVTQDNTHLNLISDISDLETNSDEEGSIENEDTEDISD